MAIIEIYEKIDTTVAPERTGIHSVLGERPHENPLGNKYPQTYTNEEIERILMAHTEGIWYKDDFIDNWPYVAEEKNIGNAIVMGVYGGFQPYLRNMRPIAEPKSTSMRNFLSELQHASSGIQIDNYRNLFDQAIEFLEIKKPDFKAYLRNIVDSDPRIIYRKNNAHHASDYINIYLDYITTISNDTALVFCLPEKVFEYPSQYDQDPPVTTWEFQFMLEYLERTEKHLPIYIVCGVDID